MSKEFLKSNERPNPKTILGRMSEDGECLLSGKTDNLTYIPVDTDPSNILPCNMACIANDIAQSIIHTCYYEVDFHKFKITFDTPQAFITYNKKIVESLLDKNMPGYDDVKEFESMEEAQFEKPHKLFELLTRKHVKGIFKISYPDLCVTVDRHQYQGGVLRELVLTASPPSNIIKPNLSVVS